ncbi:Ubiquitin-protein ligase [Trachipleistophora hominis]|uniref:Ubiquitin-conjugating enzyme E2 H n=1 Tax=Trachipleistophora hominis TaxID=72359 RepID=L7JWT6_TRAHO|nr:Ubiquitin-protein ligase [Trachipleistophora hominis]
MSAHRMRKSINRLETEIYKLRAKGYLKKISESNDELIVELRGPKDTPFHNGLLTVSIVLPLDYPFKSPSIGFVGKIFHPNIDESSGSVCLDVLNQVWTPLYDLQTIVEVFIPQLLAYPNAMDPLNTKAAQMYLNDRDMYNKVAREYVTKYSNEINREREDNSLSYSSSDLEFDAELV